MSRRETRVLSAAPHPMPVPHPIPVPGAPSATGFLVERSLDFRLRRRSARWACELLSPGTLRHDRDRKMPVYLREQVTHVWLVEPSARTLEVFLLDGASYRPFAKYADAEQVRAPPFDAITLDLSALWLR